MTDHGRLVLAIEAARKMGANLDRYDGYFDLERAVRDRFVAAGFGEPDVRRLADAAANARRYEWERWN